MVVKRISIYLDNTENLVSGLITTFNGDTVLVLNSKDEEIYNKLVEIIKNYKNI